MPDSESKASNGAFEGNQKQKLGPSPSWASTQGRAAEWRHRAGWAWETRLRGGQVRDMSLGVGVGAAPGPQPQGDGVAWGWGSKALGESHPETSPLCFTSVEVNPSPPGSPPRTLPPFPNTWQFGAQEAPLNPGPSQGICQSPLTFSRRERTVFKGSTLGVAGLGLCCHDSIFLGPPRGCWEISEAKESTGQNLHYRISSTPQSTCGPKCQQLPLTSAFPTIRSP